MTNHRRCAAFLAALLVLGLAGCGYFSPRDPEAPLPPPERHSPTAPESVLFNFEAALEAKVTGAPQLSESLDPDFLLVLDRPDANRLNGLMQVFKQEFERANMDFLSLRVQGSELLVTFRTDEVPVEVVSSDSAFYDDLPYTIEIGTGSQLREVIKGTVDLGMKSRTNWAIATWIDKDSDGSATETYGYYMGFYSGVSAPGDILK